MPYRRVMVNQHFNDVEIDNEVFTWALATRLQMDRWEALLAPEVWTQMYQPETKSPARSMRIRQARIEHHFCLTAAGHLLKALKMRQSQITIDPVVAAELKEGRDLHEHWDENVPIFNTTPRPSQPKFPSGKSYAARNPDESPYFWLRWDSEVGPKVMPHVPGAAVHDLVDRTLTAIVAKHPEMADKVLPRPESPWRDDPENVERWWPRSPAGAEG